MQTIKVKKATLIKILEKNRQEHRGLFLAAQDKYRTVMIDALDQQLKLARHHQSINLRALVQITIPTDHTDEYDRAIGMLKLDVGTTVALTEDDYSQYVNDDWGWTHNFANQVTSYGVNSPKFAKYANE